MSTATLNFAITFTVGTCCRTECGVQWAMTDEYIQERRRDHANFYCPNGHGQHYTGETAEQKRIRELEAAKVRLAREVEDTRDAHRRERDARQQVQRSLAATKGVLTKTRKRVAAGACPCCSRTFAELTQHMAAEHPEYTPSEESDPR